MQTRVRVGPFELVERIGAGGMAEVWRAERRGDDRSVAVKVITGARAFDPRYQERFVREVQAVARLNHPGIVPVFDYGRVEQGTDLIRDGSPFLIMELADRGTLEEAPSREFSQLRRVLLQVLDALAYSHARGVVHRDIKPANVLLCSAPNGVRAQLTDFGIAHADDPDTDMTRGTLGETAGTPEYMPPEQLQGRWRDYGPWTDLYALGCMAWEIATGNVPFTGGNSIKIAMGHLSSALPPFEPRFEIPAGFEQWIRRLLEKKIEDRFPRAADAAFMLGRIGDHGSQWEPVSSGTYVASAVGAAGTDLDEWGDVDETAVMPRPGTDDGYGDQGSDAMELFDADTTVLDLSGVSWAASTEDERLDVPPVPVSWRREQREDEALLGGLGLGLFGLREIPFVDREDERDVMWEALRDVAAQRRPRVVVISGRSGTGKSRAAQWICRRADELGAATVLQASHGAVPSAKHGLGHMLERYFVCWRIEKFENARDQIARRLERLWHSDDEPADADFIEQESRAITTIACPAAERDVTRDVKFSSTSERLAAVRRVVERIARERPVILWVDDAQWGNEALALVESLAQPQDLPILVLVTVQEYAQAPDSEALTRLETLVRVPTTQRLQLDFLAPAYQHELVRRLAGLERRTAQRVVRATGGNPLFAVQLVGHWVERELLVPTPDGYVVPTDAEFPEEIHSLWQKRVGDLTARLGGEEQLCALELAATLGHDVSDIEWQATCIVADIHPHERLIDELVDQGLAVRFEGGWSFVHKLLADSIRAEASVQGRAFVLHRCCGEVLRTLYEKNPEAVADRVAGHFIAGEAWEDALDPLVRSIQLAVASGDMREARSNIQVHRDVLDEIGVDVDDPRRVENWLLEANVDSREGNPRAAKDTFGRVLTVASAIEWSRGIALANRGLGEIAASSGRPYDALAAYSRAEEFFSGEDPHELAALYEARSWAYKALGDGSRARADLESALDLYRSMNDGVRELNVFNRLAFTFLAEGDMDASREVAEMGIELGRQLGNRGAEAGCWTTLGEIERFDGRIEQARYCYGEAERLDELCGSRHVWVVRLNRALLEVAARNWTVADERLGELRDTLKSVGLRWGIPIVELAQSVAAAAAADWATYDKLWTSATQEIDKTGMVERDVAWLAEFAAQIAFEVDDVPRGRQAAHCAMKQWEGLGDAWKARELRIQIRTWSRG